MKQAELEQWLARLRSNAFIGDIPELQGIKREKVVKSKLLPVVQRAAKLERHQLELIIGVLEGEYSLLNVNGVQYAAHRTEGVGWGLQSMAKEAEMHIVEDDLSACSCEDSRFRSRDCKHILALKKLGVKRVD